MNSDRSTLCSLGGVVDSGFREDPHRLLMWGEGKLTVVSRSIWT